MQKLYLLFCVINFIFPESYYTWKILTIGHDCPVPVVITVIKIPPDPLGWVEV